MKTHEIRHKNKEKILLFILVIAYIAFQIATSSFARKHYTVFNGVFSACQYGLCLLMLHINSRKGIRISVILLGISISLMSFSLIMAREISTLPGLFNGLFYLITLVLLARYYRLRELESVTDLLTGALNRRGLYRDLAERIDNNEKCSVICLSLDNFKAINDNYGHAYGDELVRQIAKRINGFIGTSGTISKLGSEFVVVLNGDMNPEQTANSLLELVQKKTILEVNDNSVECYMTCYAGVASYPDNAFDYESLIKFADIAMADAMTDKSKSAYVFNQKMADEMNNQIEIEHLIKEGLQNDYFYMMYQPQFLLDGKKLRGFEALIRMKKPDGTIVSPAEFIPVAEKSDLILKIDQYVLKRTLKEFKEILAINSNLILSVNVSAKNIGEEGFAEKIATILNEASFPSNNLEIEITEYCMLNSLDITIANIKGLRNLGVKVALDDFGTGYTSLSYVAKLPINLLKIDKSLVDDITTDEKSREFIRMVISLGHLVGCEVISEGVEEEQQLEYLRENQCDFIQGYVWAKPQTYDVAKIFAGNS